MLFNNAKFQVLQFGRNEGLKTDYMYLSPDASELTVLAENVRDLGVILNNKLDYKDHIDKVYKKVKQ